MALCGPIPSSLSVSNCHESSKKCPAWELLDLGHKPEFKDMHLVKAKVVLSETGRWGYCINQLGSVPFLLGEKKKKRGSLLDFTTIDETDAFTGYVLKTWKLIMKQERDQLKKDA